ncbi:DUF6114 domain-containing protein [Halocatena salina]|uniref:DUF6114 domain-containing protein n=1 Tax=Halocatena salina TaxID=2934340 RepID=A0A8U0A469_9EURY|nr:DUF6114 domain-containing protein [Halocatena salina]UPM43609.1 DUF6114 domain-containing protein [Halocatena salina]
MTNANYGFMSDRRQQFEQWRQRRPVLGGVFLLLGSVFMFYVPMFIAKDTIFIGGNTVAYIGLVNASFIFLIGVFSLTRPEYSTILGYAGVVFSFTSLLGTLGGLLIGMILSLIGSNLCIAWDSDLVEENSPFSWNTSEDADSNDEDSEDMGVSGLVNKWR